MAKNREDAQSECDMRAMLADAIRPVGESNVAFCRRIVEAGKFGAWDDGRGEMLVDVFSASAVITVYDALSKESAREKLRGMPMLTAVEVCFKVINNAKAR